MFGNILINNPNDLTVDPYTQATNGKVRLVINAYFDAKPRRAEAFIAKVGE